MIDISIDWELKNLCYSRNKREKILFEPYFMHTFRVVEIFKIITLYNYINDEINLPNIN